MALWSWVGSCNAQLLSGWHFREIFRYAVCIAARMKRWEDAIFPFEKDTQTKTSIHKLIYRIIHLVREWLRTGRMRSLSTNLHLDLLLSSIIFQAQQLVGTLQVIILSKTSWMISIFVHVCILVYVFIYSCVIDVFMYALWTYIRTYTLGRSWKYLFMSPKTIPKPDHF